MSQTISITNFKNEKDNYENNVRSNSQTKSVWFEAEALMQYLQACIDDANNLDIDVSGFRIYLTAHQEQGNPISLAFCPTYEDDRLKVGKDQISFDPKYSQRGVPADLSSLLNNPPTSMASSIFNMGSNCPDKCPER